MLSCEQGQTLHDVSQVRISTSRLSAAVSSTQHLLHHVARHAVEEECDEDDQQEKDDDFQDKPAIVVPEDVSDRLEWVEEPDERRIRSTTTQTIQQHLQSIYKVYIYRVRLKKTPLQKLQYLQNGVTFLYEIVSDY